MKINQNIRIGIGQINPTVGDFDGNREKIIAQIKKANAEGVDLLVFPELSVCGYPVWDLANKKQFIDAGKDSLKKITQATKGMRLHAVVGFIDDGSAKSGKSRNALAVISNGKIIQTHDKVLLPTYDVFLEQIYFESGESYHLFKLKNMKAGTSICEDLWDDLYPLKPTRQIKRKGADLLINISASPFHRNVARIRHDLIARKAKKNKLWIIYANQVGSQDDLVFDGRSLIANPKGEIVFQAPAFQEGLFIAEIGPESKKQAKSDPNQVDDMYRALVLGIRDYMRKNRFAKAVIGMSGGIDSALVATLACDAIGASNVLGVTMPGEYSSTGSYEDSEKLAKNLGFEIRKQPITPMYKNFIETAIEQKNKRGISAVEKDKITLAMENLQARLRALQLMYISNDENRLLLSTGNKSELAMGYCTLYGDMCGGLCVLGDVYKTDVYKIARYRNSVSRVIPDAILDKAPSAELRPNQKDQDSLPPYEALDKILEFYIEKNLSKTQIAQKLKAEKVSLEFIADILQKVNRNEYKRRQTPPLIRVTEKAWFGRRMPITNQFG